jgi:hypothetical protein
MMLPPKPIRIRSAKHLARLRKLACTIPECGGFPVDAHHLTHVEKRGLGQKPSDALTVPLCRWRHHSATSNDGVHHVGNESDWWRARDIDPVTIAQRLWNESEGV